jgi:hypothetical protein
VRWSARASVAAVVWLGIVAPASPCSISGPVPSSDELIRRADVIVIAVARDFLPIPHIATSLTKPPSSENGVLLSAEDGRVRFEVVETLKGRAAAKQLPLTVEGRLEERDDFNEYPVVDGTVRHNGDGPCYALSYRFKSPYVLLLKTTKRGTLTPYWSPRSRSNDQLRPGRDEWLEWVRSRLR